MYQIEYSFYVFLSEFFGSDENFSSCPLSVKNAKSKPETFSIWKLSHVSLKNLKTVCESQDQELTSEFCQKSKMQ